ncbi:MAG: SixA phosphatase family protein [Alphaproteobacteria bacterium]
MIYLNLMRHAKTDLNNCNINDFERPICKKGILKTEAVKKYLEAKKISFDLYFCSPSVRTKQTLQCLLKNKSIKNKKIIEEYNLYDGDTDNFLLKLSKIKNFKNILVLTHEPQISYFLNFFLSESNCSKKLRGLHPVTSSIISIKFDSEEWESISNHNAEFFQFIDPNKLLK